MPEYTDAEILEIKKEARDEGKLELKEVFESIDRGAAAPGSFEYCKKPEKFVLGRDDIKRYIQRWDAYRRVVNIQDNSATRIFLTFLEDKALNKILDNMSSDEKDSWTTARPIIVKLLEPTYLPFEAKAKLVRAKQRHNESVEHFISRLLDLGNKAFKDDEKAIRDRLVLDTFLAGLKSQQMAMLLFSKFGQTMTLAQAQAEAKNLEIAVKAREITHGSDNEEDGDEGKILAVGDGQSYARPQPIVGGEPEVKKDVKCFNCQKFGHYSSACKTIKCRACGLLGHIARNCRAPRTVAKANYFEKAGGINFSNAYNRPGPSGRNNFGNPQGHYGRDNFNQYKYNNSGPRNFDNSKSDQRGPARYRREGFQGARSQPTPNANTANTVPRQNPGLVNMFQDASLNEKDL